jgi:hypothetical protein
MVYLLRSNFIAASANIVQHAIDAQFVDDAHAFAGHAQAHEAFFRFNPKTVMVQVRQKTAFGAVFCVGYIISGDRTFTGDLTDSGHDARLWQPRTEALIKSGGF